MPTMAIITSLCRHFYILQCSSSNSHEGLVPKLRFPEFKGEWNRCNIGEYLVESKEYATKASDYPLLTSSRQGLIVQSKYFSKEQGNDYETLFSVVPYGFITYRHMSDDNIFHFNINYVTDNGLVSKEYPVFSTLQEKMDTYFLVEHLNSSRRFLSFCKQQKKGGTRTRLYFNVLKEYSMFIPNIDEQRKIASFLSLLDERIRKQRELIEHLKSYKRGALKVMFPQNSENVPRVRFKGFTDAWEQCEFKSLFDFLQNNTLSRTELSDSDGDILNIHYGDILVKFGEIIDIKADKLPHIIDNSSVNRYSSSFLQDGDIVIADAAEDETVGKCSEISNIGNEKVLAGLHTIPLRTKKRFAHGYLGYYLNSNSYHDQLLPLMQGTKVSSISKSALQDTIILFPKSLEEQQHIASYFRNIDNLITLYQHKIDESEMLKRSLLKSMLI